MNSKLLELFYKLKKFNNQFKNNKLRFVTNDSVYDSNSTIRHTLSHYISVIQNKGY